MSVQHGGPIILKPISEFSNYLRNFIPANIPETYGVKPLFHPIAREEDIRKGVIAYRDFLYLFCDRLKAEGDPFVQLEKKPKSLTDYPFLYHITDLLADVGYYGQLSKNGDSLIITELPAFLPSVDALGNKRKPKNSVPKLMECMRFLDRCGFVFHGIDLEAKTLKFSESEPLVVSYPNAPHLLTGLKVLAIADIELRTPRYKNDTHHDNLLWCDYKLIMEEETDLLEVLKNILHALPQEVQNMAVTLHQRYLERGMTCVTIVNAFQIHFAYTMMKNSRRTLSPRELYQQRIWEFALSPRYGHCLVVRAKKTEKYGDVIGRFPLPLQEKIARGYGCDRKRNEPCQSGCAGIRIPLDDSILEISEAIETWLDYELSC